MCVISAVVLYRTSGFAGIAGLLSSQRRAPTQSSVSERAVHRIATWLTHPVTVRKGWLRSRGGE